jgi:hypothetical protein
VCVSDATHVYLSIVINEGSSFVSSKRSSLLLRQLSGKQEVFVLVNPT